MKYTAKITNKDIFDGLLRVQVKFTSEDGNSIIQDSYETSSPSDNWPSDIILKKVSDLEKVFEFKDSIELGEVLKKTKPEKTSKELFNEKFERYSKLNTLLTLGIIDSENSEITSLKNELINSYTSNHLNAI